jgi:hypothetical protein
MEERTSPLPQNIHRYRKQADSHLNRSNDDEDVPYSPSKNPIEGEIRQNEREPVPC